MTTAYFETSAVLKLVLVEDGSDAAGALWDAADPIVTSRISYAEARAALAAANRSGRLTARELSAAKLILQERLLELAHVEVTADIVQSGGDLAEGYGLRGYDAIHLASALVLEAPELIMVTWDRDLARASRRAGLNLAGIAHE